MTTENLKEVIFRVLGEIAPEADLAGLEPGVSLREQMDIDSMDFLNFVIALHKETGVEILESDYPRLTTLNGCIEFLSKQSKNP